MLNCVVFKEPSGRGVRPKRRSSGAETGNFSGVS